MCMIKLMYKKQEVLQMKNEIRKTFGKMLMKLGEHEVGKSMILGMFDPEIPQKLKDEVEQNTDSMFVTKDE